ncbi:MAG: hypothetical protein KME46_21395 [Brasilonema angustatum HA4187-MV1]|nr:hypothetical protein [Brasilonema angustatum HA4187-MV1]
MPKPNLTRKYDPKCLLAAKKSREIETTIKKLRYEFNAYYYGGLKLWWGLRKMEIKADHYESGAYQDYQICKGKFNATGEWMRATYDEERRFAEVWKPEWEEFIKMYWESFGNGIISIPEVEIELDTEINVRGKGEIDLLLERTQEILEFFAEQFADLLVNKSSRMKATEQVKEALRNWNRKEKEDVADAIEERVSLEHAETLISKQYVKDTDEDSFDDQDNELTDLDIKFKAPIGNSEIVQIIHKQTEKLTESNSVSKEVKVSSHPTTGSSQKRHQQSRFAKETEREAFFKEYGLDSDGEIEGVKVVNITKKSQDVTELNSIAQNPF